MTLKLEDFEPVAKVCDQDDDGIPVGKFYDVYSASQMQQVIDQCNELERNMRVGISYEADIADSYKEQLAAAQADNERLRAALQCIKHSVELEIPKIVYPTACEALATTSPTDALREHDAKLVEDAAKAIYSQWTSRDGYVPWVDGGNSLMQDVARGIAKGFMQ